MVKLIINGERVQQYLTGYKMSIQNEIDDANSFEPVEGAEHVSVKGQRVYLALTLEDVPSDVAAALYDGIRRNSFTVSYTTFTTALREFRLDDRAAADISDSVPDDADFDASIREMTWGVTLSLVSVGLLPVPDSTGGL